MSKIIRNWRNWKPPKAPNGSHNPLSLDKSHGLGGNFNVDSLKLKINDNIKPIKAIKTKSGIKKVKFSQQVNKSMVKSLRKSDKDAVEDYFQECLEWSESINRDFRRNNDRAVSVISKVKNSKNKRLATTLATIISKIADDDIGEPIIGDDEWDTNELLLRSITKRNINQCRMSRERENIVITLDTSPSCNYNSIFYSKIAYLSCKIGNADIYAAPNARITHKMNRRTGKYDKLWDTEDKNDLDKLYCHMDTINKYFNNKTIMHFSDNDGSNYIRKASFNNKFYWFHTDRNPYIGNFKGKLFTSNCENNFINQIKKMR